MARSILTDSGARLCQARDHGGKAGPDWLFVPGGPGLGSEYLRPLAADPRLPGTTWLVDLPGDGRNTAGGGSFSKWPAALVECAEARPGSILVAHSFAGMLVLATPEIEQHIGGLALVSAAPDGAWRTAAVNPRWRQGLPSIAQEHAAFHARPTNQTFEELIRACAPYFFPPSSVQRGEQMMGRFAYRHEPYLWAEKNFNATYSAKWVPSTIPALIVNGGLDLMTPGEFFRREQKFARGNIEMVTIAGAGHFPWLENPSAVRAALGRLHRRVTEGVLR